MSSKLFSKSILSFLNPAKRLGLGNVGVSLHAVSATNSVHMPILSHAEGMHDKFLGNISLLTSASQRGLLQDSAATLASPLCVASVEKLTQSGNTAREQMDAQTCAVQSSLHSDIDRDALTSAQTKDFEEPQAELCASGQNCVTTEELGSVVALADWLRDRLPSGSKQIMQWGVLPGTKRMANLWLELLQGEISLEDSRPPKRTVHVACVKITNGSGRVLLEAHQEMADGSIRERNRPLSEKMKPGENVEDACLRGINEELGSQLGAADRVTMLQDSYRREVQERESFSYPGLMTCYVLHHMEAIVKQLPDDDFVTQEDEVCDNNGTLTSSLSIDNESGEIAVGVKRHFWKWVPDTF